MNERQEQVTRAVKEALLRYHVGRPAGISCRKLAAAVAAAEREVREAVTALRRSGHPVCGTPSTGYFIARTREELDETCVFLRGRALHTLGLEASLRKVSLPRLVGQMQLDLDGAGDQR